MLKHIVAWNLIETTSEADANKISELLNKLIGQVEGLVHLKVHINLLSTSTRSVVLDSTFTSEQALDAYQIHPLHQDAVVFIKSITTDRVCLDYFE